MELLLVVVRGSKYFQKWKSSELRYWDFLITHLLSNHGMTLRSPNKGPEAVSHFLSTITLTHRFCKLITSCLLHVPQTITPVVKY